MNPLTAKTENELRQARDDLAESERRFREIADLLPGIICEIDTTMKVTYVNEMGLKTFGFTHDDFENGINANDIFFPEDRERIAKDVFNIFHGDYGNPVVYRMRAANGAVLHALINSAPLLKNGTIAGIRTCIIDISARIAAEELLKESEERFRTVFARSPIGIALFKRDGALIDRNAAFSAMFGREPADSSLFDLLALTDFEKASLRKGNSINRQSEFSFNAQAGTGADRWFDWHMTPLGVGERGASAYLVQVQDITENKKRQDAQLQQQREATAKAEALVAGLKHELLDKARFGSMVSRSPAMQEIFAVLPEIANAPAPVLIFGESGTGKELIARSLHDLSARNAKPFVAINCAALPDTLLESELFGYHAGAFTDAKKDKPGKFARAEGGTLFLDEIGDISAAMQAKLLRVLQEKSYDPLGASASVKADVRIIAATNRDLAAAVKKGEFREDLYYRINTVAVKLPPLRERRCDIPLLCDHFLERFNLRYGKSISGISQEAMQAIIAHEFPGNIRELENAIEHCFVFCKTAMIEPQHLPASLRAAPEATDRELLSGVTGFDELERRYINAVLIETDGNKLQAAQRLGVHKTTLFRKLKKLGI
jgi:PAS domain S-box-containing protein